MQVWLVVLTYITPNTQGSLILKFKMEVDSFLIYRQESYLKRQNGVKVTIKQPLYLSKS